MSWEMTMASMLAITAGAAIYVAWPLLTGRTRAEEYLGTEGEPVLQQLLIRRDVAYAALKELEFDRAAGNVSQDDFQQLQDRYKRKAILILRRIDQAKAGRLPTHYSLEDLEDEEIEMEQVVRAGERGQGTDAPTLDLDVEQEIEAYRMKSRGQAAPSGAAVAPIRCPSCGQAMKDTQAAFCSRCGESLQVGGRRKRRPAPEQRRK